MGLPGALIGGALLGLGLSKMGSSSQDYNYMSANQGLNYQQQSPLQTVPQAPEAPTTEDGKKSDAMLAAEEEERRKREAEAAANKTNHTGGLGLTTPPSIGKNTLLG